ncbi:MAG: ABC transporter ATP-binding protein [Candidatus Omnitrophica bacterium]|nr:ABC transporter ATP-binding protein [Candidatus Omnitrophota bacterium]
MKLYLRILRFLRPHAGLFVLATGVMLASAIFDVASLGTIIPSVDRVFSGKPVVLPAAVVVPAWVDALVARINSMSPVELLDGLIVLWAFLFGGKAVMIFLQTYLMAVLGQLVVRDIRSELYERMMNLSMGFFDRSKAGILISRVLNDTGMVQNSITQALADMFYQFFLLIGYASTAVVVAYSFGIPLTIIVAMAVTLPLVVYPILRLGKRLRKISYRSQAAIADISSHLMETLSGVRVIKASNMVDTEAERFRNLNQAHFKIMRSGFKRFGAVAPLSEVMGVICVIIVMWFIGRRVAMGELSLGAFIAFLGALLATIRPFRKLSSVHAVVQQAMAAAERIFEIIDEPSVEEDLPGAPDLPRIKQGIHFEAVHFRYASSREPVLAGLDLQVPAGSVTAIVGPSGSGKTTIVSLLMRFYEPTQGRITIDGCDIAKHTRQSLRAQTGIVTQEPVLFHDTVRANIAYGAGEVSDEQVRQAAAQASALQFIEELPEGFNTVIGDRGHQLSGGQAQRLTIARALLQNPPILILDEATSQLDSESERAVQQAIDQLMEGRTVFVIAHRLATVRRASQIVVLEQGRIVGQGKHEELLAQGGLYKLLCEMQFETSTTSDSP